MNRTSHTAGITVLLVMSAICTHATFGESAGSPLEQTRNKILADQVKCNQGLALVFKATNLMPACVTQAGAHALITRGWAVSPNSNAAHLESMANPSREYNMVFLVNSASPQYNKTLASIAKHLKAGDYLLIEGYSGTRLDIGQKVQETRSLVSPGVNVGAIRIYSNIDQITRNVPNLPKGFGYIGYDYEQGRGFSPEFTTNETESIHYFDKARSAVEQYNLKTGSNAKFLIMPPYGELRKANWDWGQAARHADMVDIQFQAFIKDGKFLSYVLDAIAQIKQEAPSTKAFVQLSLIASRGTAQDNLDSISMINKLPIDAFLMFYHPNQTQELEQFLQIVPK